MSKSDRTRNITVSEGAARLIGYLRTDGGLQETKAYIADAMDAAVCQLASCETIDRTDLLPLVALSRYHGLITALAEENGRQDHPP